MESKNGRKIKVIRVISKIWIVMCIVILITFFGLFALVTTPKWTEGYHHFYLVGDRSFEVRFNDGSLSTISLGVHILITEDDIKILSQENKSMRKLGHSILEEVSSIIREQANGIRKDQFPNEYLNVVNVIRSTVEKRWPLKFSMEFIEISSLYDLTKEVKTSQDFSIGFSLFLKLMHYIDQINKKLPI